MPDVDTSVADHPARGRTALLTIETEREVARSLARLVGFDPDVLEAVACLSALAGAARRRWRAAVLEARAVGYTWARIPGGMSTYRALLEPGEDHLAWTCLECHSLVEDRGTGPDSPADAERGHVRGCARYALLVVAYRRRDLLDGARRG